MLLNTLSLTKEADEFSLLTFTGYIFISMILLICRFTEKNSNYHICEIILLSFGVIFFTTQGLLTFSIVEQLQDDVSVFSYVIGSLSFICALLFALDLFFFKRMSEPKNAISQTDLEWKTKAATYKQGLEIATNEKTACCRQAVLKTEKKLTYLRTDL
ncbi:GH20182 [Drosophila grimshawi]|uniref:GH20182 n=2 Tax=Drosophila grimshawi TaxID=7222 RepID=B4J659_DROGR|nr:GH20182 [Drosophila grimshawi]